MELQPIKPRRALRFRSKQEIIHLLEKYESLKKHTSMTKFCKNHDVPTGTFCTWQRYRRQGKYAVQGKFIALSVEPVPAIAATAPLPVPVLVQEVLQSSCTSMWHQTTFNLCLISRKTYDTNQQKLFCIPRLY